MYIDKHHTSSTTAFIKNPQKTLLTNTPKLLCGKSYIEAGMVTFPYMAILLACTNDNIKQR